MASRKEYELLFKLQASLGGNFNAAFKGAADTARQLQNSMQKLNSTTGKIESYKKQETALESNRRKLQQLTAEHNRLQTEISKTEQPSEELRAALQQNERQIAATTSRIDTQQARLQELGNQLSEAGVNTSRLTEENERLSRSYDRLKSTQEDLAKINSAIGKNKEAISQTKAQLGGVIGAAAAVGAAIYAGPVKKAAEFQSQMSTVQSIVGNVSNTDIPELAKKANDLGLAYKEGANATETAMNILSAQAKQMGATTQFTAAESGQALEYMAMAGWKASQMMDGLPGIMNLAAASGENLGSVSDIVTDALTAFGMTAEDSGRFADVLAQASSNANTNVGMMGATFQKVAPVAGALGYSVEDMSLAIGLMANASIKADVAGTSLKTSLANMAKPTKQMQTYMDKYGISLTRTDGSMKTFREVVDNLRGSLGGLSESEQVAAATAIFGKESFAGMLAIVNASDEDFNKLSDSISNAEGAAAQMAAIKMDNLEGDMILLQSAADGLQLAIGDALLPAFRAGAQGITDFISRLTEFINANPELVRQVVQVVGGLLAFRAAALTAKLGFLELKGGVLGVQKGFALLRSVFALASVNSMGFSSTLKGVAKSVTGYLGGIGKAAGGVGSAFAQMFSGTKIGSLFSGIGSAAGGIFTKMFTSVGGAVGGIFTKLFSGIGGVAAAAAGKVTAIFAKAGIAIAAGPLGKIGGVIGAGFGRLSILFAPLQNLGGMILGPFQKLGGAILGPLGGIAGKILPVVGVISLIIAAVQIFKDHLDDVRNLVERIFGPAGAAVFDNIVGAIANIGDTIRNIFSEGNLAGARKFINSVFGEQGVAVFDTFISIMQTVGGVFREFIAFIDANIKPAIEQLFAFVVTTVLPQIAQAFVEWGPQIISVIQNIWQIFQTVSSAVISIIQFLMPTIQSLVGTGLEMVRSVVSGVLTAIQGILSVFSGIFTGNWTQIWTGAKNIFSGIWQSIGGIARGALNGIIGIINGLIGGLNKLKIPDWVPGVGGKGINIPLIPQFAKGTPRTPDTFIAGEAGAELITNAKNRTVFNAAATGRIFDNLNQAKTPEAGTTIVTILPMLQAAIASAGVSGRTAGEAVPKNYGAYAPGFAGIAVPKDYGTYTAGADMKQLQFAYANAKAAAAPEVEAPTLTAGARQSQSSIVIHSAPVFHVGSEAQAQDIEEALRQHDEQLMKEFEEKQRQQQEDERRTGYD